MTALSYHEGKFKVVTVKGTFFHCKGQSMEDGNEYLEKKKDQKKNKNQLLDVQFVHEESQFHHHAEGSLE